MWCGQLKQLVNVDVLIFEYGFYSTNFAIRLFFYSEVVFLFAIVISHTVQLVL